jgi:hypothetical protein
MKKHTLVLILALGAIALPLAACNNQGTNSSVTSEQTTSLDAPTAAAYAAIKMLDYSSQAAKGLNTRTFQLAPTISYSADYKFQVVYSITQETVYAGAAAKLVQDTDPDLTAPNFLCQITAPFKDKTNTASYVVFKLTADLYLGATGKAGSTWKGGTKYASTTFNIRCDPISVVTIKDIPNLNSGDAICTYGIVTGKYDADNSYLWVGDGESGITAYGPSALPAVGTVVKVYGSYSPYGGLPEFAKGCTVVTSTKEEAATQGVTLADPVVLAWDGTYTFTPKDSSRQMTCSGSVKSVVPSTGSDSLTVTITVGGKDLPIWVDSGKIGTTKLNAWKAVKVGDNLKLSGWLSISSSVYQLINATIN